MKRFGWLAMLLLMAGCAVVTVNVYFPEEDVKMAYDQMEDEFMRQAAETPAAPAPAAAPAAAAPAPQSAAPAVSLLATPAEAAPVETTRTMAELTAVMRTYPDVVASWRARGDRREVIEGLLNAGMLGLTADGLVTVLPAQHRPANALEQARELLFAAQPDVTFDSATPAYVLAWVQQQVNAECADRNVNISGMARALIKLISDEDPAALENDPTLRASMERQARRNFADRTLEHAPATWWLQGPDGKWQLKVPPPPPPAAN